MYSKGDIILYNPSGVCEVVDIRKEKMAGVISEYYVLSPLYQGTSTIYVPADNPRLTARMRSLLSIEKVQALMSTATEVNTEWIEDSRKRAETYAKLITEGDTASVIAVIRLLLCHKAEVLRTHHKFYASDQKVLAAAQKLVGEEFAYVLGMEPREVMAQLTAE